MANKMILIIDDHKNFRETLRSFIENQFKNVEIKEAVTGEEGVAIAISEKPDVSLIDVRLPGIDGIEAARQIKQHVPACQIITTSMFQQSSLQNLIAQKVIIFVNKDEIDSELIPLLHKFLDGRKIHKLSSLLSLRRFWHLHISHTPVGLEPFFRYFCF